VNGHIVNMNSVVGHSVPFSGGDIPAYNIYPGTKYAVTATTEVMRQELLLLNNDKIRFSSISPGLTKTDILDAGNYSNVEKIFNELPSLTAEDISATVLFVLSMPQHVQIAEVTIKPQGERF
jgi:NADP+-dependent farnesol dehydrogenase